MSTYALGVKSGNVIFDNFGSPAEPFLICGSVSHFKTNHFDISAESDTLTLLIHDLSVILRLLTSFA